MSKIFDSRDTEYKSPFGAAVCGATVIISEIFQPVKSPGA